MPLSLRDLTAAVTNGVGVRVKTSLQPLGGSGDKIYPPSYAVGEQAASRYAVETRRIDGNSVATVVLDSVASQANRFESALLDAYSRGELVLPVISVDFRDVDELEGYDVISSLEAPHRVFDAILRDSLLDDVMFRLSDIGQDITEATTKNAAAVYRFAPTVLVFGGWDSTGPKGGRGAKYERALTSEVVGIGVEPGVRQSSRIDPLGIEIAAGTLYATEDGSWTLDEKEAAKDGNRPRLYRRSGEGPAGRPSQANHGNIAPTLNRQAGGVTVDRIEATTVLSFVQLRRLQFPIDTAGQELTGQKRLTAENAGRTALAALALAAVTLAFDDGFDLRSRCVLVAEGTPSFELLVRGKSSAAKFTLTREEALSLVADAEAAARQAGLEWESEEILLTPSDRLARLVRQSQRVAAEEVDA